ncbi:MAG: hypothetical protein ACOC48_01025, partial [Thiohalospira sp.]
MTTGTPQGITAELVAAGQLDAESARAAESTTGSRVEHLVGELGLPATAVAEAAGRAFGLPVVDLTAVEPLPEALEGLRPDLLRRHRVLPFFRRGQRLAVALADPGLLHGLDELQFQAGVTAEAVVAPRDQIEPALEAALAGQEQGLDEGSEGAGELDELDSIGVDAAAGADTDDPAAEGVDGTIAEDPDADTELVERCVALATERWGDGEGGTVRTDSDVPLAAGLKSSSAAANATVLATCDALGLTVGDEA